MKLRLLITGVVAAVALSGCVTYDTAGASRPGGYYQGRPQVRYYDGYGYGYPSSVYGGYYYGSPYYYGRTNPYYGYYGPYYPYYPPHRPPPRPRPDDGGYKPPPGSGQGGTRPAPWRDPTRGAWRDHGEQPMVPGQSRPVSPGARPSRGARPQSPGLPPRTSPGGSSAPRAMPRSIGERPASPAVPRIQPGGGRVRVVEP